MKTIQMVGVALLLASGASLGLGLRLLDLLEPPATTPGSFDRALRGLASAGGLRALLGLLLLAGGIGGSVTALVLLLP